MDIVEFFCKFGNGDYDKTRECVVEYFGETSLLYSILKRHNLLESKIDHIIYDNCIKFIIYTTDSTLFDSLENEYKRIISIRHNYHRPIDLSIIRDNIDPCKIIVTMTN